MEVFEQIFMIGILMGAVWWLIEPFVKKDCDCKKCTCYRSQK